MIYNPVMNLINIFHSYPYPIRYILPRNFPSFFPVLSLLSYLISLYYFLNENLNERNRFPFCLPPTLVRLRLLPRLRLPFFRCSLSLPSLSSFPPVKSIPYIFPLPIFVFGMRLRNLREISP